MKVQKYYRSATPTAGSVAYNTDSIHGRLLMVRVKPTTTTTTWHIKVTDATGFAVYESDTTVTGEQNDGGLAGFIGLVKGVLTVTISAASVDEAFDVQLDVEQYENQR